MSKSGRGRRIVTWLLLTALAGCGGGESSDSGNNGSLESGTQVLYLVDEKGNSTSFLIDATTGALKATATPTGLPTTQSLRFSAHPSGKFVYATNQDIVSATPTPAIVAYAVTSTGALSPVAGSPFTALTYYRPTSPVDTSYSYTATFDPAGKFLYVGSYQGCQVFSIDQTSAAITPIPGSPFAGAANPFFLTYPLPPPTPWDLASSDCGFRVGSYLVSRFSDPQTQAVTLYEFAVDPASGALTLTNNQEQFVFCCAIPVNFVALSGNSFIYGAYLVSLDSTTGALSTMGGFQSPQYWQGVSAMDPSGEFILLASNPNSDASPSPPSQPGALSSYSVDSTTGTLTPLSPTSTAVGIEPVTMTFDHTGKFLYVMTFGTTTTPSSTTPMYVYAFTFDSTNGTLTPVPGSPFALTALSPASYLNQMFIGLIP